LIIDKLTAQNRIVMSIKRSVFPILEPFVKAGIETFPIFKNGDTIPCPRRKSNGDRESCPRNLSALMASWVHIPAEYLLEIAGYPRNSL
jgi:hypothetical protein